MAGERFQANDPRRTPKPISQPQVATAASATPKAGAKTVRLSGRTRKRTLAFAAA